MDTIDPEILLVEDDPTLQFVFKRQLHALGYRVSAIADNGLSAVEKAFECPYHLIFMDVRMPGIDGINATKRIRSIEREFGFHTRIVGMTAFAEKQLCLDAGMDDFLQKPVMLDQLSATIERWLKAIETKPSGATIAQLCSVSPDQFKQTDEKLKIIQDKITNLRRKVGLE
jgi:CheY-like chemotaxis protein